MKGEQCYAFKSDYILKIGIFEVPNPQPAVFLGANRQKCVKFNFFFGFCLSALFSMNKNGTHQNLKTSPNIGTIPPTPTIGKSMKLGMNV